MNTTQHALSAARRHMVEGQILVGGGVQNAVVRDAMMYTPREHFLPSSMAGVAYAETEVRILPQINRTLATPYAQGRLLDASHLNAQHNVLIIGGCTGYTAALVHYITPHVSMIETVPQFVEAATQVVPAAVRVQHVTSLAHGLPDYAPYDRIIIEGAVEHVPHALIAQLAPEGYIVAGVLQQQVVKLMHISATTQTTIADLALPELSDFALPPTFVL